MKPYAALMSYCVFCNIIAGREPAAVIHDGQDVLVFRNVLRWLPMMLLAVPKRHVSQEELWSNLGEIGQAAVTAGREFCPNGFRLVSNFGWDALQSQPHAHVHVIGGGSMDAVTARYGDVEPVVERDGFRISRRRTGWPPTVLIAEPLHESSQEALWQDIGALGAEMVRLGRELCPYGFRLVSDVGWDALQMQTQAHLYLLGGAELGHYV